MFSLLDLSFVLCSRALFTCSRHMLYSRALFTCSVDFAHIPRAQVRSDGVMQEKEYHYSCRIPKVTGPRMLR